MRLRSGEIQILRHLSAEEDLACKVHPLIQEEGQKLPDVGMEFRRMSRDYKKREFTIYPNIASVVIRISQRTTHTDIFTDEEQYQDPEALGMCIQTVRDGLHLLNRISLVPREDRGRFASIVSDEFRGTHDTDLALAEASIEHGVGSITFFQLLHDLEKEYPIRKSQFPFYLLSLLEMQCANYVVHPLMARYDRSLRNEPMPKRFQESA